MIQTIDELSEGDILRVEYHNETFGEDSTFRQVIQSIDEQTRETIIQFADEWGDETDYTLSVTDSGARIRKLDMELGPVISAKAVGSISADFGKPYIMFRPPPYRDHIIQQSIDGEFRTVCDHDVNVDGGEKIREDKITPRQRSLLNLCNGCVPYFREHVSEELPASISRDEIERTTPFLCPECSEPTKRIGYSEPLDGVVSHHEDRQCGPWDGNQYLRWRLEGSDQQ